MCRRLLCRFQFGDRTRPRSRCRREGSIAVLGILGRKLGRAVRGASVAAAARSLHVDEIPRRKLNVLVLRQMYRHEDFTPLPDLDSVRLAGLTAENAGWSDPAMIHHEGGASFAASQRNGIANTESSAVHSRAGRVFGYRKFLEQHGETLLQDLDGRRLGNADRRTTVRDSVEFHRSAVSAARHDVHDEIAASLRVRATYREVSARAGWGSEQSLRHRLGKSQKDRFSDALADFGGTSGYGPRILRIEERADRDRYVELFECPGVDRDFRKDMLNGEVDRGLGGRDHAVHRSAAGLA